MTLKLSSGSHTLRQYFSRRKSTSNTGICNICDYPTFRGSLLLYRKSTYWKMFIKFFVATKKLLLSKTLLRLLHIFMQSFFRELVPSTLCERHCHQKTLWDFLIITHFKQSFLWKILHPTGSKIFMAYGHSVLNMTENCSKLKTRKQIWWPCIPLWTHPNPSRARQKTAPVLICFG